MKINYHSHTTYSDGSNKADELLIKAIENGYTSFGISDHSPVPFQSEWNMKYERLYNYIKEMNKLKRKFSDKLDFYIGMEIDFIENIQHISNFKHLGLDYTIGGVHYLPDELEGRPFNIDKSMEVFTDGLNRVFGCNIEQMVEEYYNNVIKMLEKDRPDIVAHINLIEKFNHSDRFFNPDKPWYKSLIKNVLESVSRSGVILELNCRSKYKRLIEDFAPSLWIVRMARNYGIPFTISGDVHKIEELSIFWEDAVKGLKDAGYTEIMILKKNRWEKIKI